MDPFFYLVIYAGAIAGASCGLLGVYIVGMRMPFIGTCISHAAMAGTVWATVLGINPTAGALIASVVTAASLTAIKPDKTKLDTNVGLAILFSLMLGLTFLGMGLITGSKNEILSLLWGSILYVQKDKAIVITVFALILGVFAWLFNKEMKVLLFSRSMAQATGVHSGFVYCLFLCFCGIILAVNLPLIGGLMIFSLITSPAASAYQLCRGHLWVVIMSITLGVATTIIGFGISYFFDLPTGACIVIVSTLIFGASIGYRRLINSRD
ncbi:MAG TPA: metal ABC transporter permease [Sedimentisphaerales bacterium]|nr:metal ABC transporter permease [Sedimentisphaerales bacterium]